MKFLSRCIKRGKKSEGGGKHQPERIVKANDRQFNVAQKYAVRKMAC